MKRIGDLRDGLLVGAGLLYVLGYVVWSLYALVDGLGPLPLIDSQYLVAGIVPALSLGLAYLAFRGLRWLIHQLPSWIGPDAKGRMRTLRWIVMIFHWIALAGFLASFFTDWIVRMFPGWPLWGSFPLMATIWLVAAVLYLGANRTTDAFHKSYAGLMTYFIPIQLGALALSVYIGGVHPRLPQELGGARPRCGYLDVLEAEISEETRRDLLPPAALTADRRVERSSRLSVIFSGSDFMLVRPFPASQAGGRGKARVYELDKGVIQAVSWCDRAVEPPSERR